MVTPAPADRQLRAHPRAPSVTPDQVETFLAEVARHGGKTAAAVSALPDRSSPGLALRAFNALRSRDPAFAMAWDEAAENYRDALRREIDRRGRVGVRKLLVRGAQPVVNPIHIQDDPDHGFLYETEYSDSLLLAAARAHLPEFVDRKIIDGKIDHVHHNGAPGTLTLSLEDVSALSTEQRVQLGAVLKAIKRNRNPMASAHATPALESRVTDAEFSEPIDSEMAELARINC